MLLHVLCQCKQQCNQHEASLVVNTKMGQVLQWMSKELCGTGPTFSAAAQLSTFLWCSGTMSFQLKGALGDCTSVLKILHPNSLLIRTSAHCACPVMIAQERRGPNRCCITHNAVQAVGLYAHVCVESGTVCAVQCHRHRHGCAQFLQVQMQERNAAGQGLLLSG